MEDLFAQPDAFNATASGVFLTTSDVSTMFNAASVGDEVVVTATRSALVLKKLLPAHVHGEQSQGLSDQGRVPGAVRRPGAL